MNERFEHGGITIGDCGYKTHLKPIDTLQSITFIARIEVFGMSRGSQTKDGATGN